MQTDTAPLAKTSVAYWMQRVKVPAGRAHYGVQIAHRGRRQYFSLETAEKSAAASKARQLYLDVVGQGWESTMAKHRPKAVKKTKTATVGALIEAATRLSSARKESLDTYAKALRHLAASALAVKKTGKLTPAAVAAWRARVDELPLDKLTPAAVLAFKNAWLKAAITPEQRGARAVTFNSLLRNSKALLSKKVRPFIAQELILPESLWFQDVPREEEPSLAYRSRIDAGKIIAAAQAELAPSHPEPFKAMLLCLAMGLRRSEADALLWEQFDFDAATLELRDTAAKRLKSKNSAGLIGLDAPLVAMLRGFHTTRQGAFVLETPRRARFPFERHKSRSYRCDATFNALAAWLLKQGVPGPRPIHLLRKEVGSMLASTQGIFAAAKFLRHSDIRITHRIYADAKTPISAGLGALLAPDGGTMVEAECPAVPPAPVPRSGNRTRRKLA